VNNLDEPQAQVISLSAAADERLVRDLHAGRASAHKALIERLFPFVDALVWRNLGADDEHEDVVNDVLVDLLANAGGLRSAAALTGWARVITLNCVRSLLRKRRVRRLFRARTAVVERFSFVPDPSARPMLAAIFRTLDGLGADERLAFSLRYLEALPLQSIADALGLSLATAKRRLHAAESAIEALGELPDLQRALPREGAGP
jgi:RNA polymerase sigma-70 factor (ECF subfamily)